MANLVIKGGTSQQIIDGSQDTLTILSVNNGTGLVHVGDPLPAGFDVPFRRGDQIILPANEPATLRADGFIVEATTGQYGGQTYEGGGGGGDLPSNKAIVENGTSVTLNPAPGNVASLGPVYINVLGNVASFWLSDNRTAVTNGATAPVQNSAGAAIATGTFRIAGNAITYIRLPATVAGVSNGDIVTATGGQTIDIGVAAGVPSFTVQSGPQFLPFTVTAADLDGTGSIIGYYNDPGNSGGAITNEPLPGYILKGCYTASSELVVRFDGPSPLLGDLAFAHVDVGGTIFVTPYNTCTSEYSEDLGIWVNFASIPDVPAWTVGQQIPIVIIPQNG